MAWRVWRRYKLAPGVTVNLSKSGLSTSFGPHGARLTVGRSGTRETVGGRGTGVFVTQAQRRPTARPSTALSILAVLVAVWSAIMKVALKPPRRRR
jgi:hypothetical protein